MFGNVVGSTANTSFAFVNVSFQLASVFSPSIGTLYPTFATFSFNAGIRSFPSLSLISVHHPKWFNPKYLITMSFLDSNPNISAILNSIPIGMSQIFNILEFGRNLLVASATIAAGFE